MGSVGLLLGLLTGCERNSQADRAMERSVRSLSGGERRRVALALAFGFADLVKMRGKLHCNVMVLDEVRFMPLVMQQAKLPRCHTSAMSFDTLLCHTMECHDT